MDTSEEAEFTILHSRSVADLPRVQSDLVGNDFRDADLFLRVVRDTASLSHDEERLLETVREFTFEAFPQATHIAVVTVDPSTGVLRETLLSSDRQGASPPIPLSRTLVRKVVCEGVSLLFTRNPTEELGSESIQLSRIEGAVCAPLWNRTESFGVMQIDIRSPGKGTFSRKDVDRLALFAHYLALGLYNLQLYREQTEAFSSTIQALMHSLSLKDPETAQHSERVEAIATYLGRTLGISGTRLDVLRVAALLHDMGKQGVRDAVLFKPARLTDPEMDEMNRHAHLTQNILDKIRYPLHLKHVPEIAAYHHEKLDGSGPYGIPGDAIPLESRIISVADCFDALISARAYKQPMHPNQVLGILEQGAGREWDPVVVETLRKEVPSIMILIYGLGFEQVAA